MPIFYTMIPVLGLHKYATAYFKSFGSFKSISYSITYLILASSRLIHLSCTFNLFIVCMSPDTETLLYASSKSIKVIWFSLFLIIFYSTIKLDCKCCLSIIKVVHPIIFSLFYLLSLEKSLAVDRIIFIPIVWT